MGEGVEGLTPGDEVIGVAYGTVASHVTTAAEFVLPKPASLDFEEAAAVPVAFVTAYISLVKLARLQPGERVLIHAATGGVGLAAIQVARDLGAEVRHRWDSRRSASTCAPWGSRRSSIRGRSPSPTRSASARTARA